MAEAEFASHFDKSVLYSLFALIFFANIMINIDHGTLPGSTKDIETKLDINDFGFGVLGSVVYGGLTIGSAIATIILSKGEWIKPALISSLFMNSLSLYAFTISSNFMISSCLRIMIGFFQVFVCIF